MTTRSPHRRRLPRASRRRAEHGAATAELAMVLPLLVAVTIGLVWLLAVGAAQVRVVDAARETARSLARGDDTATATSRGRRVAPGGAQVAVSSGGAEVSVTVTARVEGPGGLFAHLGSPRVRATAVAALEETG